MGVFAALEDFAGITEDPRTKDQPLVGRTLGVLGLMAGYVIFVKLIGPWLMRDRQPFQLRQVLLVYNCLQIAANVYIFQWLAYYWLNLYSWRCEPIDRSTSPTAMKMVRLVELYLWLKISDLLDTVFFVLRKKNEQITFLHVYHHSMMILLAWQALKYFPGGHGTFIGLLNTLVHAVMYGYYLVSALYPGSIWWKKYVTQLQLVQHAMAGIHLGQLLVDDPCGYPLYVSRMLTPQAVFLIWMFLRFYKRAYCSQRPKAVKRKLQ